MRLRGTKRATDAMTLMEVSVVIAVIAALVILLLPTLQRAQHQAQIITCNGHLKGIVLACKIWEGDNSTSTNPVTIHYPMLVSTNSGGTLEFTGTGEIFRHFQIMSNILSTPKVLICPSDGRLAAAGFGAGFGNTNLSYFVNADADDSFPEMAAVGDRNLAGGTPRPNGLREIKTSQSVQWTQEMHKGVGNVGLSDGSVQRVDSEGLNALLQKDGLETNRLLIP